MGSIYQKYSSFFQVEDIESNEIIIKSESDIDDKYHEKIDLINNDLLVSELEENKYYMYEEAKYSLFDMGLIKKENDVVLITNIFYTEECPDEKADISFYFKPTREYGILDYQKYKAMTISEVFSKEQELLLSYQEKGKCEDDSYFTIETNENFQELTSTILFELLNQKNSSNE